MALHSELWARLPGIVWSNPDASDEVRIANALLHPRFFELLEIAAVLGLGVVEREWGLLEREGGREIERVRPTVERILCHIREGMKRAAESH